MDSFQGAETPDGREIAQFWDDHFGSQAAVWAKFSLMTGLGRKAAIRPGSTAAFPDTGHSDGWHQAKTNGSQQPEADADEIQPTGLAIFRTAQF